MEAFQAHSAQHIRTGLVIFKNFKILLSAGLKLITVLPSPARVTDFSISNHHFINLIDKGKANIYKT